VEDKLKIRRFMFQILVSLSHLGLKLYFEMCGSLKLELMLVLTILTVQSNLQGSCLISSQQMHKR
jgi:hypothetical protein